MASLVALGDAARTGSSGARLALAVTACCPMWSLSSKSGRVRLQRAYDLVVGQVIEMVDLREMGFGRSPPRYLRSTDQGRGQSSALYALEIPSFGRTVVRFMLSGDF